MFMHGVYYLHPYVQGEDKALYPCSMEKLTPADASRAKKSSTSPGNADTSTGKTERYRFELKGQ